MQYKISNVAIQNLMGMWVKVYEAILKKKRDRIDGAKADPGLILKK